MRNNTTTVEKSSIADIAENVLEDNNIAAVQRRGVGAVTSPAIELVPLRLTRGQLLYQPFKRLIDIVASFICIILLSPVFLITAIVVKLSSPGPVLFKQIRVGKGKEPFKILKFRSMMENADDMKDELLHLNECEGPFFKIEKDPRVTRAGRFIRKTSIDELPQFFNVLIGNMSLVGPRPPIFAELEQYNIQQLENLFIKPGITCYWQVSGRSDNAQSRLDLDEQYIQECNLITDIKILLKTFLVVFKTDGAC